MNQPLQETPISVLQTIENNLYQGMMKLCAMRGDLYTIVLLARVTDDLRNEQDRLLTPAVPPTPDDQG